MEKKKIKGFKLANVTLLSALALALSGCGDDPISDTPSNGGDVTVSLSGNAADGYLTGATICLDINTNKVCDTNEPTSNCS